MLKYKFLFLLVFVTSWVRSQDKVPCISAELRKDKERAHPEILSGRIMMEREISSYISGKQLYKTQTSPVIIPVVFHIIHEDGEENISDAQVKDQIRILNEDYQRKNADASQTPAPFAAVAANCEIEFRLATKDPQGNCTNGIVRVFSHFTNGARDNVKSLSYWNSSRYLNIWVVKSIKPYKDGTVLGYAQFPGGDPATDGVVLRHDVIGTIGTAATGFGPIDKGRSATHEVGHWLNLYHTWGDDDGECFGSDEVSDTPNQADASKGCSTFPLTDKCTQGNGVMFMNYMDYTDGHCMNLFTQGQKARMLASLSLYRSSLTSSSNLIATGTDILYTPVCAPKAWFTSSTNMACPGTSIIFNDNSYNGTPKNWQWSFPGGIADDATIKDPTVVYPKPGLYSVSLTVSNTQGAGSVTRTSFIRIPDKSLAYTLPYYQDFSTANFKKEEWIIENDDNGPTWTRENSVTAALDGRMGIRNFAVEYPKMKDVLTTPFFSLKGVSSPVLSFKLAYKRKSDKSIDQLYVYVSTDCGKSWFLRPSVSLSGSDTSSSEFTPNPLQWKNISVPLTPFAQQPGVLIKFVFVNGDGNNVYIDDLSLSSSAGNQAKAAEFGLILFPNPSNSLARVGFNLYSDQRVTIKVFDSMGREVEKLADELLYAGEHSFTFGENANNGLYFIQIMIGTELFVEKFVKF